MFYVNNILRKPEIESEQLPKKETMWNINHKSKYKSHFLIRVMRASNDSLIACTGE